jgi:hypothetical protein
MGWWQWAAAIVEAILLSVLVLLWYDNLRDRKGWSMARATKVAAWSAISIPIGFVVVLMVPFWLALVLVAIPALAVAAMAMAS